MPCRTRAPRNITSQIMRALSVRHATVWTSSTAFLPANLLPIPIPFLSPSFPQDMLYGQTAKMPSQENWPRSIARACGKRRRWFGIPNIYLISSSVAHTSILVLLLSVKLNKMLKAGELKPFRTALHLHLYRRSYAQLSLY